MIEIIRTAWSWSGLIPTEIVKVNLFGNLIIKDSEGTIWRICPEELSCAKIADDYLGFSEVWKNKDFQSDWDMAKLVLVAKEKLGILRAGCCYCFKLSPVLGGTYDQNNMSSISLNELISFSGKLAHQIKDVPDGGKVKIELLP